MAEGINAGDVVWKITGESKSLDKALKVSTKLIKQASTVAIAGGLAIAGAMTVAVKSWANAGDEIQKMALRTGFATETLSELKFAAELSGTSLDSVEKASKKLAQTIFEAGEGTVTYTDALAGVGLQYEDLEGLSPEEQFLKVAFALADVEDQTKKTALAQEIFGRAGTALLPMLAQGSAGLEEMRKQARELGIVFSQEDADAAAEFNDSLQRLQDGLKGMMFQLGPVIAQMVTEWLPAIERAVKSGVAWLQNNRELLATWIPLIAKFAAFSIAVGTATKLLIPFVGVLKLVGTSMKVITGLKTAGAIAGLGKAAVLSSGSLAGMAGALAGPLGVAAALAIAGFAIFKTVQAWNLMRDAQKESKAGLESNIVTINNQAASFRKQGVAISDSELNVLSNADALALMKERITEAEVAQGREISALNGVSQNLLVATDDTEEYTGGIWDMNTATNATTGSTNALTQSLNFQAQAFNNVAQAARNAAAAGGQGGGGGGRPPGMATGGMITGRGSVRVHKDETLLLPAGAEVLPRQHSPQGQAMMAGQSMSVGDMTIIVNGAAAGLDVRALVEQVQAEMGETLFRAARRQGSLVGATV